MVCVSDRTEHAPPHRLLSRQSLQLCDKCNVRKQNETKTVAEGFDRGKVAEP